MTTVDEEEERTWARPSRRDVRRVLRGAPPDTAPATGGSRLRPAIQDDRDLPDRWPSLVAEIEAVGGELGASLRRMLELRKSQWLKRHYPKPWPLRE